MHHGEQYGHGKKKLPEIRRTFCGKQRGRDWVATLLYILYIGAEFSRIKVEHVISGPISLIATQNMPDLHSRGPIEEAHVIFLRRICQRPPNQTYKRS